MDEFVDLPLRTADGRPLIHKYRRHKGPADGLLAVFPGKLYGVDGPLLFYPSARLWETGWDTWAVSYGFQTAGRPAGVEAVAAAFAECQQALGVVLHQRPYARIGLLGKSLGASVVAHLCCSMEQTAGARAAYLTPPLGTPAFDGLFGQTHQPSHVVVGTADGFFERSRLDGLRRSRPFGQTIIEGGDHSLIREGDLDGSIEALRLASQAVIDFLLGGQLAP